ncbi:MAG: hypothetical protein JXK93_13590 [Sphaerochaetaceae bacterium]|nr:hypothetical protein [Sphaerochaetaceae bacterium]
MGLNTVLNPHLFQGRKKGSPYFEGWYFKMAVSEKEHAVLSVIPGISRDADPDKSHAFIQVITSLTPQSWYIRYPLESFLADEHPFSITIGSNRFSLDGIVLAIDHEDLHLHGKVTHRAVHPFPVSLLVPGIMGWYRYVPFMECFHGVVSTQHGLEGEVNLNGKSIDVSRGTGYIEKDWGTSFPSAWVWMQSNSFPDSSVSCMLSVARIPFLFRTFTGFLGFVEVDGRLIRFATYTGARIQKFSCTDNECTVSINTGREFIEFSASLGSASHLKAPRQGSMDRIITESVMGTIALTIYEKDGSVRFSESGILSGIELSETQDLQV